MPLHNNNTGKANKATLSAGTPLSRTIPLTLSISGGSLVSWDLQERHLLSVDNWSNWATITTNITTLEYDVTGLTPNTTYQFRAVEVVVENELTGNIISTNTSEAPARFIRRTSSYPAAHTDGMFQDQEPIESGVGAIPTIAAPGRTMLSNFNNITPPSLNTGRIIYGVRFLLGNMRQTPISGGKMIVGLSAGWNGYWTPLIDGVTNNVITGNLMTGWQKVTIGGDELLPIPAAEARTSGMPLKCVWTDWVTIPAGWSLAQNGWDFFNQILTATKIYSSICFNTCRMGSFSCVSSYFGISR
jgi:hypothetical protein